MDCLICGKDSVNHGSNYGGLDVGCPECGRYIIRSSLISAMSKGYAVGINQARAVLTTARERSDIPILDLDNVQLHRLSS
ncbi:hypothetical protein D3C77_740260 [compost metagenome]